MIIPAAQYLRVSSDMQRHSLGIQSAEIAAFAEAHGYEIIKSYADSGKSGLRLKGREALQDLLADVLGGKAEYRVILVQDVSRWGRFQDSDEAAHYEFVCQRAGVEIHYCSEDFATLGDRGGNLFKAVKRLMAAEFSRELSGKTRRAQYRWAEAGFKMGGVAGYGLRRALVAPDGSIKSVLEAGQQRLLRGDRIILVHGPPHEVQTVRRIFQMYLDQGVKLTAIADVLNAEKICGENGRLWSVWTVGQVLSNPKYAGVYRYGRRRRTLDGKRLDNAKDTWLLKENALEPIIPPEWIDAATLKRQRRMLFISEEDMLARAKDYLARVGTISRRMINEAPNLPSARTYYAHFGGWNRLCARLDFYPTLQQRRTSKGFFVSGYIDPCPRSRHHEDEGTFSAMNEPETSDLHTAFIGDALLKAGTLAEVALAVKSAASKDLPMAIVFNDANGAVVDLDLRGTYSDVLERLSQSNPTELQAEPPAKAGRGRPRLGVTPREVTLLPRHWAWLNAQNGGASAAIRRLVEQASKDAATTDAARNAETAAYKVMYALAGHLPNYEEALRALYAGAADRFATWVVNWPTDISAYIRRLAQLAFDARERSVTS